MSLDFQAFNFLDKFLCEVYSIQTSKILLRKNFAPKESRPNPPNAFKLS